MNLYVVRHAIAEERPPAPDPARPDSERALTPEGREKFLRGVRGLGLLGVGLDLVLHSPWRRAAETAALLAPLAALPALPAQATGLLAREPSADLIAMLDGLEPERVALVGHEPWLSDLIAWLVTGDSGLGYAFPLKKGGVAHLEGRPVPGAMRLGDLWRPRTLRDLGGRT